MQNYQLILAYDGSRYQGWQGQGNTPNTIQAKVQAVLERMCGQPVTLQASGRTDAGVHAMGQVVSCQLETALSCPEILAYLNRYLPEDIGALSIAPAPPRFHARLSARGKVYAYRIWNSPLPDVFGRKYRYALPQALDLAAMEQAGRLLEGEHDFRSFCGLTRYKKSTVRRIDSISISREGEVVTLRFHGNGFLNRMVRILSGTLVEVGLGLRTPESMSEVLEARDRASAAGALPPQGLMLEQVFYGEPV
ncbi:MAG: tRNA pseudouridine(38-40) synthase TruA [Candidatus Onthomonas sp.]